MCSIVSHVRLCRLLVCYLLLGIVCCAPSGVLSFGGA